MAQNHILLETITLTQNAALVTFNNIPQSGYTDLKIVASMRDVSDDIVRFSMGFNSTSKTTTTRRIMYASGAGNASSTTGSSNTSVGYGSTRSTGTGSTFGSAEIYISNYLSGDYKTFSVDGAEENFSIDAIMSISGGLWSSNSAINSISIICDAPNFAAGSRFSIYGIAAVGTTPAKAPFADGGNVIASDGTYWYHAFTSSGTFTPNKNLTCDTLVVAGGGGGGFNFAGGGGAGGLVYQSQAIPVGPQVITIGAGGAAGILSGSSYASNGGNSSIGSLITAIGGGAGGGNGTTLLQLTGRNGGSGGGGGGYYYSGSVPGGTATSGQGSNGGTGIGDTIAPYGHAANGGGGGAGGVGGSPASVSSVGGAGGNGLYYDAFGSTTGTGHYTNSHYYYAGGGGGASSAGISSGGYGGGGNGGQDGGTQGVAGTANTGGGGGGSKGNNTDGLPGGSGIVIIRYPMA